MEFRIRVDPKPSPAVMAAIVAAVRARRSRAAAMAEPEVPRTSRWALAGRREAMAGRDGSGLDPSDRW